MVEGILENLSLNGRHTVVFLGEMALEKPSCAILHGSGTERIRTRSLPKVAPCELNQSGVFAETRVIVHSDHPRGKKGQQL